jgi:hypothetical protein
VITQLAGDRIECFGVAIAEQHVRASFNERRRDRFADSRCCAGYDGAFVF